MAGNRNRDPQSAVPDASLKRRIVANVRWGVGNGVFFAIFFSAIAFVTFLHHGARPFLEKHVTFGAVILVYFIGGVLGGAVLGLLRPLSRFFLGALVVGTIVGFVLFASIMIAVQGLPTTWDRSIWLALIFSLVLRHGI